MTNRLLPLVAACAAVCAAACATLAHAAPSQADLERTRLYGDVSIAQDSVNSWGVWEQFEPPAAGPATPIVALAPRGDVYRPIGNVTPTPTPPTPIPPAAVPLCASGALCGFGVFSAVLGEVDPSSAPVVPDRFAFVTRPQVIEAPVFDREQVAKIAVKALLRNWEPDRMRMLNEALNGGEFEADSGVLSRDGQYYGWDNNGQRVIVSSSTDANDSNPIRDPAVAHLYSQVYKYISGQGEGANRDQVFNAVWGITTSATDMAALTRNNVIVTYTGNTLGVGGGATQNVTMAVDFANSKIISGQFGAGVDGKVSRAATTSGGTQLSGQVGFTFTGGDVVGSTFRATNLQAADARAISGTVQGAFFGANAAVAAGVADVVKTKAGEGGYTNARYTDNFITYKAEQPR